ncbi:MAG: hypothetical protein KBD14_02745 [Candidatus Pacebacteria bacterium]|nr:hypothetical protein [Candidatus Paceibacterota bacterium]
MITKELINYIKSERKLGKNEEMIRETLMKEGWSKENINEGFSKIIFLRLFKIVFFTSLSLILLLVFLNLISYFFKNTALFKIYLFLLNILQWPLVVLIISQFFLSTKGLFVKNHKFPLLDSILYFLFISSFIVILFILLFIF